MANEATIRCGLTIRKMSGSLTLLDYSKSTNFQATVTGTKGPTPGAFTVSVTGTDVDLSELTTPGFVTIKNLDATNFVTYGIRDPDSGNFFPLGELLPGEAYVLRLSRYLFQEFYLPPTGTGTANNTLRFVADTSSVVVSVEAFEA